MNRMLVPGAIVLVGVAVAALAIWRGRDRAGPNEPTFARDIAPIVFEHCAPCHREGEAAPFPLLSFADVHERRRQIVRVTSSRYMPPWLPAPGHGEFVGARRLPDAAIDTLRRWVEQGAAEGDPRDLPTPPEWPVGWQLGEPDVVATMPEAFDLPADGPNVFRNFVIPAPVASARFVRAVEIRPGNLRAVHHAVLQVDRTDSARQEDAKDALPGFPGMWMAHSEPPDGHFIGWTPGKAARPVPDDMAWRLEPGTSLVLQLHLTPTGKPERIAATIGFHTTDRAPTRRPFSILLFEEDIDLPAGASDVAVRDEYFVPVDVDVHSLYPHAHYLGKRMLGRARLPDGSSRWLFRIDDWDFDWQDEYRFVTPLALPAGTVLSFEYHYDNSAANERNPHDPPRHVRFGFESTDEMATLTVQVVPRDPAAYQELEKARWVHRIGKTPFDWDCHFRLARLLAAEGRFEGAIQSYENAIRLRPDSVEMLVELGGLRARNGDPRAAIGLFERALAVDERLPEAHNNLANAMVAVDRPEDAVRHYRRAVELRPDYFNARFNLGRVLVVLGRPQEALPHLRRAVELRPDHAEARAALQSAEAR
jgi:hypothetical protein